jgi:TPR repeat protein
MPHFRLALTVLLLLALPCVAVEKGKRYALVVGVNSYTNKAFPPLEFAENDADELAAVLKKAGFQVTLLSTKLGCTTPTASNIRKAVEELVAGRKEADTVLIALAGHGVQLEVEDREGKEKSRTYPYFCPHDAEMAGISFSTGNAKRLINLNWVFRQVEDRNCSAGRKLILVDACRNLGKAIAAERRTRSIDAKRVTVPDGVCAMFSCAPGQVAYEHAKLGGKGHGIFFHFVLEGLRGKAAGREGDITWNSLSDYVSRQMAREVGKLTDGNKQTPHLVTNIVGESPVLIEKMERSPIKKALAGEKEYARALELALGRGTKIDQEKALALFRRASDLGHPLGKAEYATYLFHGVACTKDEGEGQKLARSCIAQVRSLADDRADAMAALARCLQVGLGTKKDVAEAVRWYKKAAGLRDVRSQYDLAVMYDSGLGVEKDAAKALELFRKAAEAGYVPAYFRIALMHEQGKGGLKKDKYEATRWYLRAAELGDAGAQNNLGYRYQTGKGAEKNEARAVLWFQKAAAQKHPGGLFNLGVMYERGLGGLRKDRRIARLLYRRAAARGFGPAKTALKNLGEE